MRRLLEKKFFHSKSIIFLIFRCVLIVVFYHFRQNLPFPLCLIMFDQKTSFHPALAISNIKNYIHVILEMENVQHGTWTKIFKIHSRSHKVTHHIIKPEEGKKRKHLLLMMRRNFGQLLPQPYFSGSIRQFRMTCYLQFSKLMQLQ